jgi:hypothetical protein
MQLPVVKSEFHQSRNDEDATGRHRDPCQATVASDHLIGCDDHPLRQTDTTHATHTSTIGVPSFTSRSWHTLADAGNLPAGLSVSARPAMARALSDRQVAGLASEHS